MKKIIIALAALASLSAIFTACEKNSSLYDGPDHVMFADTLTVIPVYDNEEYIEIPLSATRARKHDRKVAVEIVDSVTNAIEGKHFVLESQTAVIKAGELSATVKARGIFRNIAPGDSLVFTLRIVDEHPDPELFNPEIKVRLRKICPFDINTFKGYAVVTSNYMMNFMPNVTQRLITTDVDPETNTVVLHDYFYDGYDVSIRLKTDDPERPDITMEDQLFALTEDAFGTLFGDGTIRIMDVPLYTSYYDTCENFVFQYFTLYVENVDVVGTFISAIRWISDDEAEKLRREQGL